MNKVIALTLAAATLVLSSSCSTSAPSGNSSSMPGMSAQDHAKMKQGSMPGMNM